MEQEILGEGIGCTEEDPAEGVSGGGVDSPKENGTSTYAGALL